MAKVASKKAQKVASHNHHAIVTEAQPLRVAIYSRVSTTEQAKGLSLGIQVETATSYAKNRNYPIAGVYVDAGVSGTRAPNSRPELKRLLNDVKAGKIDIVLVASTDRLSRKALWVLEVIETLDKHNAYLLTLNNGATSDNPDGRLNMTMHAGIAEYDLASIQRRTNIVRKEKAIRDGENGGRVPFGYTRLEFKQGIAIDEAAAETVRLIFRHKRSGKSLREIAETLNKKGITSPMGSIWHASTVKNIIDNREVYKGGQRGKSDTRWPAIL